MRRVRMVAVEEQLSVRITWDVFVSSLHFGRRGCILADGWAALHRGDQVRAIVAKPRRAESWHDKDAAREHIVMPSDAKSTNGRRTVLGAKGRPRFVRISFFALRLLDNLTPFNTKAVFIYRGG